MPIRKACHRVSGSDATTTMLGTGLRSNSHAPRIDAVMQNRGGFMLLLMDGAELAKI